MVVKRVLDAAASDFERMNGADLAESIRLAEGRTLAVEIACAVEPSVEGVSGGELAASVGADMLILDQYDAFAPHIAGVEPSLLGDQPLLSYRRMLGRPLGVNLISADPQAAATLGGRLATDASVKLLVEQGVQVVFLYTRPKQGGTPALQAAMATLIKQDHAARILLVGVPSFSTPAPRHQAGIDRYTQEITALMKAGCDAIGLPMPGTKQGWQLPAAAALVDWIHECGGLAWMMVTGSIEGATPPTLAELALLGKQLGADAFRLDEAGLSGMPPPENIMAFSVALRGQRHTYRRMASSVLR